MLDPAEGDQDEEDNVALEEEVVEREEDLGWVEREEEEVLDLVVGGGEALGEEVL